MATVAAVIAAKIMDKYIIKLLKEENDIVFEPDTRWGNIYGNINDQGDLTDLFSHYTTNENFNDKVGEINNKIQEVVVNTEQKIISAVTDGKVSLDGYATEQWVEDKHYISGVDLRDYSTIDYVDALGNNVVANSNDIKTLSAKCEDFITLEDVSVIKGEKGLGIIDIYTQRHTEVYPAQTDVWIERETESGIPHLQMFTIKDGLNGAKGAKGDKGLSDEEHEELLDAIKEAERQANFAEQRGWIADEAAISAGREAERITNIIEETVNPAILGAERVNAWIEWEPEDDSYYFYCTDRNGNTDGGLISGKDGKTPVKGVDYFTDSDIDAIANSAYTKVYNDNRIAKKADLDVLSGTVSTINRTYATTSYVSESIAQAKLDGSDVDLSQYALREEIPNNISELNNDAGYLTENELSDYLTKTSADTIYQPKGDYLTSIPFTYAQKSDIPTNVSAFYNDKGYLTQHQSLEDYALKSEIPTVPGNIITESDYETIDIVGTKADGSTITYKFLVKK